MFITIKYLHYPPPVKVQFFVLYFRRTASTRCRPRFLLGLHGCKQHSGRCSLHL